MKILHLFSDWKWTGPAEPVLNLCRELDGRGHEVVLAYQKPPSPEGESLEKKLIEERLKATDQFCLNHSLKLYRPSTIWTHLRDIRNLGRYLSCEKFDIVNVHQSHDHIVGGLAARLCDHPAIVIRTDHQRDFLKPHIGNRLLISKLTDGMITFSEKGKREDSSRFGLPPERIGRVMPALGLDRFSPKRSYKDMRSVFGIRADEIVIGMVARFQKYRRTEVFLEALKSIVQEFPKIKLLLIGRSSQMEESVVKPMKRLEIEPWVVLGGYQKEDYVDALACMDIFVFLVAGSDGTARALREAMAMGKPAIVTDRGILPELVEDGVSGLVAKETPEALTHAVLKLLRHPERRASMGEAAYLRAHRDFRMDRQAEAVETFYREMVHLGKWKRR